MGTKIGRPQHPLKSAIIEDALVRIQGGETLEEIAASHNIARITLQGWMLSLGDEYQQLRSDYIDHQLAEAMVAIDSAQDNLSIARAREAFRARSWIAERRDRRYSQQQAQTSFGQAGITINIGTVDSGVVIDGQPLKSEE